MLALALTIAACGLTGEKAVLMEHIASIESGGNQYALNVNGDVELVHQPESQAEALAMAAWLFQHGHSFDAGLTQVNSANFGRLGLTLERLFDPCSNLQAGMKVLEECSARAVARYGEGRRAEAAAISCYNTGDLEKGIRNGYVALVQRSHAGEQAIPATRATPDSVRPQTSKARPAVERLASGDSAGDVFTQDAARKAKLN